MKALFKVVYENNKEVYGKLFKGDWKKIPEYPIKSVTFAFLNKKIKLENFLEYNILVERVQGFSSEERVLKLYFVGRGKENSNVLEFDLDRRELKRNIKMKFFEFDGMLVNGWRKGINGEEPNVWVNK